MVFPGESTQAKLNGTTYELFAEGVREHINSEQGLERVSQYRLFVSLNRKESAQLLVAKEQMDEGVNYIMWAGDLDGDGKLDLIINTSDKTSVVHISVYLSSQASKDELIRYVSTHSSVGGC